MVLLPLETRFIQVEVRSKWRHQDFNLEFQLAYVAINQSILVKPLILSISKFPQGDPFDL